jgi:hypothetical protein
MRNSIRLTPRSGMRVSAASTVAPFHYDRLSLSQRSIESVGLGKSINGGIRPRLS